MGFTAGIAVIIFASQVKELLGLTLAGREPGEIVDKVATLWGAAGTLNPAALAVAVATIAIISGLRRWRPAWPGLLIAVVLVSVAAALLALPVETIGTRFGGIPSTLPWPELPPVSWERVQAVLPDALAFALLGRSSRCCRRWWPTA